MQFLSEKEIQNSPVVANCRMNRKRKLVGINSYEKELGLRIGETLIAKSIEKKGIIRWLDICCGEGNALIEMAKKLNQKLGSHSIELYGIDLVGMFSYFEPEKYPFLQLEESAVEAWDSNLEFDLITCIHGLHYLGDKLACLRKIARLLKFDGIFYGNIDLQSLRNEKDQAIERLIKKEWKELAWKYNGRKKMLEIKGKSSFLYQWKYLGANDQVGPNYTGQEAVNSYYKTEIKMTKVIEDTDLL